MYYCVFFFVGDGFFLYSEQTIDNEIDNEKCNIENNIENNMTKNNNINETTDDKEYIIEEDAETPVQIIIVSLWYWW